MMSKPEKRLIHVKPLVVILFLKKFNTALKISHQKAEPKKTPTTKAVDDK